MIETSVRFAGSGFGARDPAGSVQVDRIDAPGEEDAMARPPHPGGLS